MPEIEMFSLENHLADWSRNQDAVTVEGEIQEDGDYFVINPEPFQPNLLYRVRKTDVSDISESRTVQGRQLHRALVKRDVPVAVISLTSSASLACASPKCNCNVQKPMGVLAHSQTNEPLLTTTASLDSQLGALAQPDNQGTISSGTQITICKGQPIPQGWVIVANTHLDSCNGAAAGVYLNAVTIEKL